MPRKYLKKKVGPRKRGAPARRKAPRRRLFSKPLAERFPLAAKAFEYGVEGYKLYQQRQRQPYLKSKANYDARVASSDNVLSVKSTIVGTPRTPGFDEQVARVTMKPIQFVRNYQWNAEGFSGRKAHFCIELNRMNSDDLLADINTYKAEYFTNTATADPTVGTSSLADQKRYYIDYLKEKISLMNSSSNSLTGKMTLYAHKRDNDNLVSTNIPINPVTLMMYYSTSNKPVNVTSGSEGTIGVFSYDTTTAGGNYTAVYNMPGSSLAPTAVCASSHHTLSPSSTHVKEGIDFWFRKVASETFSLKPGQQIDKSFIFNDLPQIYREQEEFVHISNVSYSIHVEFTGQIVGSGEVTVGDGVVSTGSSQLSCVRQSTRVIGVKSKVRSKIVLRTGPMVTIAAAQQIIINPDTGVMDTGFEQDT